MQVIEKSAEALRAICRTWRRMGDEVVVIGKDGPGFELPLTAFGVLQQARLETFEALGALEERFLLIRARRDHVSPRFAQAMTRRMRPVRGHRRMLESPRENVKLSGSAGDLAPLWIKCRKTFERSCSFPYLKDARSKALPGQRTPIAYFKEI